jgi:hypothetical protein
MKYRKFRPRTAYKTNTPVIPEYAISVFDKFNRDIMDHKIVNEPVKRLKPKSSLARIQKRVLSARRKHIEYDNNTKIIRRVGSAKAIKTTKSK